MIDLLRLLLILLLIPVFLLLLGPLLVLAALRGRQWAGPVTLDSTHYGVAGRVGMFLLGAAIWMLAWSGLVWFTISFVSVADPMMLPTFTPAIAETPTTILAPTDTATPLPVANTPTLITTATSQPQLEATATSSNTAELQITPTRTSTLVDTPLPATNTSAATSTATPTATSEPDIPATETPTPTPAPTFTPVTTVTVAASSPSRPLPEAGDIPGIVTEANNRLREAIIRASDENLAALEELWQAPAFTAIQAFAVETSERYGQPGAVEFEYVSPPQINESDRPDRVVAVARERWRYGRFPNQKEEVFEFSYTLVPLGDSWIIESYTYSTVLPSPTVTPTGTATLAY
jgi:hypothetical protein